MIKNKHDYIEFLEADKKALRATDSIRDILFHEIWTYQKLLRKVEYYTNCKTSLIGKLVGFYWRWRFKVHSIKLGFSISPNSCDIGLELGHYGDIVINGKARIGKNCTIAGAGVLIGENLITKEAPIIGDNCYIGPGAKIIGGVKIANNVTVAANAVVTKDVLESNITVGGIPAKKISDKSIK